MMLVKDINTYDLHNTRRDNEYVNEVAARISEKRVGKEDLLKLHQTRKYPAQGQA